MTMTPTASQTKSAFGMPSSVLLDREAVHERRRVVLRREAAGVQTIRPWATASCRA